MENAEKTVLISIFVLVSIIVDVSSNSVLGDIVGPGTGLKSERVSSSLLVSYGVYSPVPVLYCNSRWLILHFEGEGRVGKSGMGGVIFERGGRFLKEFV